MRGGSPGLLSQGGHVPVRSQRGPMEVGAGWWAPGLMALATGGDCTRAGGHPRMDGIGTDGHPGRDGTGMALRALAGAAGTTETRHHLPQGWAQAVPGPLPAPPPSTLPPFPSTSPWPPLASPPTPPILQHGRIFLGLSSFFPLPSLLTANFPSHGPPPSSPVTGKHQLQLQEGLAAARSPCPSGAASNPGVAGAV